MIEERKKMELNELSAPVLGVEERSDEVPGRLIVEENGRGDWI